jgi:hypothetical protein
MSRKIVISKYEGNTHYSISVFDSYGMENHLGYCTHINEENAEEINESARKIWANEVEPIREDLLGNAIEVCIKLDEERGVEPNLD